MIKNNKPLSMAETMEYVKKAPEKEIDVAKFIKKFTKLKPKEAKKLRKKLEELELIKMNDKHISKTVDFLPDSSEELNKITIDVDLNEDEKNKILEAIKEFK